MTLPVRWIKVSLNPIYMETFQDICTRIILPPFLALQGRFLKVLSTPIKPFLMLDQYLSFVPR